MATANFDSLIPAPPLHESTTTVHGADVTTPQLSPFQLQTIEDEKEIERKKREQAEAQLTLDNKKTDLAAAQSKDESAELLRQQQERERVFGEQQSRIQTEMDELRARRKELDATPTPGLFADKSTAGKVLGFLGLALGSYAGDARQRMAIYMGKMPEKDDTVDKLIEGDLQRQREHIAGMKDAELRQKANVLDATEARDRLLREVDLKGAAIYKRIGKNTEAALKAMGKDDNEIAKNETLIKAREEAQKYINSVADKTTRTVVQQGTDTATTDRDSKPPQPPKPGVEDVKATNQIDNDIEKINRTIEQIEKKPDAWNEYRENAESWKRAEKLPGKIRGITQAVGLADIAPEQGLKTPEAKAVHQGMSQVQTSLAKGYGGVITEGDRAAAASESAELALDPTKAVDMLKRTRDMLKRNRDAFLQNRGVVSTAAPGESAERSSTAGGAVHGTRDTRGDADAQPSYSPAGPAVETKANNPDDPNLSTPLPEAPDAGELPPPVKANGVAQLKATDVNDKKGATQPTPMSLRDKAISAMKKSPRLRIPHVMKELGITDKDLE